MASIVTIIIGIISITIIIIIAVIIITTTIIIKKINAKTKVIKDKAIQRPQVAAVTTSVKI